jgi:hypothetical protein
MHPHARFVSQNIFEDEWTVVDDSSDGRGDHIRRKKKKKNKGLLITISWHIFFIE